MASKAHEEKLALVQQIRTVEENTCTPLASWLIHSSVAASSKPALDSFSASTLMPGPAMKHACSCCTQGFLARCLWAARCFWTTARFGCVSRAIGDLRQKILCLQMPGRSRWPSEFEQGCQPPRHLVAHLANHRERPRVYQICMQNPRGLARPLLCPEALRYGGVAGTGARVWWSSAVLCREDREALRSTRSRCDASGERCCHGRARRPWR